MLMKITLLMLIISISNAEAQVIQKIVEDNQVNASISKISSYQFTNCEAETTFLDNFVLNLVNDPQKLGYAIVYGNPSNKSDIKTRMQEIRRYTVNYANLSANRIIVVHGGYRKSLQVDLWTIASLNDVPLSTPDENVLQAKRKKEKRSVSCSELY